eukprot:3839787-Alexandrium_andersonii.AAC.1
MRPRGHTADQLRAGSWTGLACSESATDVGEGFQPPPQARAVPRPVRRRRHGRDASRGQPGDDKGAESSDGEWHHRGGPPSPPL